MGDDGEHPGAGSLAGRVLGGETRISGQRVFPAEHGPYLPLLKPVAHRCMLGRTLSRNESEVGWTAR